MSKPLNIIRSLNTLSTGYTVFEKNQVLTEAQLNGISSYLDDQIRLTRVELLGVGIVGGLEVKLAGNRIIVSQGTGVTTDGDQLLLQSDTEFDRFRRYDETSPVYLPFYPEANNAEPGRMMQVFELIPADSKETSALKLSDLPEKLGEMVVILFMENDLNDPDLCSGTDCDNLGQQLINTQRVMLVARSDAAALLNAPDTASALALTLPDISACRALVTGSIATTDALASLYRDACNITHEELAHTLGLLFRTLPGLIRHPFSADPSPGWIATLNTQHARFSAQDIGIQYYYDFLKDLVETWNALREVLFDDDSVLCPDINAFPKHLLLGSPGHPAEMRTGWYPSPLSGKGAHEHAHFLVLKLHTLINSFEQPKDNAIIITPGNDESVPLEARAIPYYYTFNNALPIHQNWNYRLTRQGAATRNLGYRAQAYGGTVLNPLQSQIGRYDFFRIEGHVGRNVSEAKKEIDKLICQYNLPFSLRAVLLHTDRSRITIRPPFRYTPLHGLHYLLRNDVATQLADSKSFNLSFKDNIFGAVTRSEIPATLCTDTQATKVAAQTHYEKVDTAITRASAPLGATRYSVYRQSLINTSGNWKSAYKDTVEAAGTFKIDFGPMLRTEFASPFDTLMTSNHALWLDWLDDLIDHQDTQEEDKLLFPRFVAEHPGLEHAGGVTRGGTFILVYDDKANVVADFMFPCCAGGTDESEPEEPVLSKPPYKPALAIDKGYTLLQPINAMFTAKLADFKTRIQPEWQKEIDIQKDHMTFFQASVGALSNLVSTRVNMESISASFTDKMLGYQIDDVQAKTRQVTELRQIVMDQKLPAETRDLASKKLQEVQDALAGSIADGTRYVMDGKFDMTGTSDGGRAMSYLSQSAGMVTEEASRARLGSRLNEIQGTASGEQAAAIAGLINVGGFKVR